MPDAVDNLSGADSAKAAPPGEGAALFQLVRPKGQMAVPVGGRAGLEDVVPRATGTLVRRGEILVQSWPDSAAAPLAPADGRIAGWGMVQVSSRLTTAGIFFRPDPDATAPPPPPPVSATVAELVARLGEMNLAAAIEKLRCGGVWADRWTTPDLLGQLRQCLHKPIDVILCNVLDEAPEQLLHSQVAKAFPVEMTAGIAALAALTKASQATIVMAAYGDAEALDGVRMAAAGTRVKVVRLQDHYPQSHPSLLIHEMTGRHVRPIKLPAEGGVLVIGAPAAVAVGRCLLLDEPMLDVPVALRDRWTGLTHWLRVPVGAYWSQALAHVSITAPRVEMRSGNPLREVRLTQECVAGGADLTVTVGAQEKFANADPCIRCAWCMEGCPVRIQPAGLLEAAQQDDPYMADQYGLDACIECGICSYVCPSNLQILAGIRSLRQAHNRNQV